MTWKVTIGCIGWTLLLLPRVAAQQTAVQLEALPTPGCGVALHVTAPRAIGQAVILAIGAQSPAADAQAASSESALRSAGPASLVVLGVIGADGRLARRLELPADLSGFVDTCFVLQACVARQLSNPVPVFLHEPVTFDERTADPAATGVDGPGLRGQGEAFDARRREARGRSAGGSPADDASAAAGIPSHVPFSIEETLLFPTASSVELTMMPAQDTSLYVEFGSESGRYPVKTPTQSVQAGQAAKFSLTGLKPGARCFYRVRCTDAGEIRFGARPEHSFRTLPGPGQSFTFLYGTDSHYYELWSKQAFGGSAEQTQVFLGNLKLSWQHMLAEDALFHVIGGDWVMTQCEGCAGGTSGTVTYEKDSATSVAEAMKRYVKTFAADAYGQVTGDLPLVYVLGNHDGEAGFDPGLLSDSATARAAVFPMPPPADHGDPEGRYYSFESGSAKFIVIDVMRHTDVVPQTADDWTLGPVQLDWLVGEVQAAIAHRIPMLFILAEHLDGGEPAYGALGNDTWYGRGGLRATLDDLPTGVFKGEQAQIQALEDEYAQAGGTAFFLSGHDHIAITPTEKPRPDGTGSHTWMLKGGRLGSEGFGWTTDPLFKKEMDWNLDGKADYETAGLGTKASGYFRITVNGSQSATFEYVISDKDNAALDGTVAFSRTVPTQP